MGDTVAEELVVDAVLRDGVAVGVEDDALIDAVGDTDPPYDHAESNGMLGP